MASPEKLPVLQDHLVVDLVSEGADQLPQVFDAVRTDRDRADPGQLIGGTERRLDLRGRRGTPQEDPRVEPLPQRLGRTAPEGLMPQTCDGFQRVTRVSAASRTSTPTSSPARTMRTSGLGASRSTSGRGSQLETPQLPHSPACAASARTAHACASISVPGRACSGLWRSTVSGSRPRSFAACSTPARSRAGPRECSRESTRPWWRARTSAGDRLQPSSRPRVSGGGGSSRRCRGALRRGRRLLRVRHGGDETGIGRGRHLRQWFAQTLRDEQVGQGGGVRVGAVQVDRMT